MVGERGLELESQRIAATRAPGWGIGSDCAHGDAKVSGGPARTIPTNTRSAGVGVALGVGVRVAVAVGVRVGVGVALGVEVDV